MATPTAVDISRGCLLTSPSAQLGPAADLSSPAIAKTIRPPGGVWTFSVTATQVYAVNGNGLFIYSLGGSLLHHFALPSRIVDATSGATPVGDSAISQPIVSPHGDVYVSSYYGRAVVEVGPGGQTINTLDPGGGNPTNIFALTSPSGSWELGVTTAQRKTASYVYNERDAPSGSVALTASVSGFTNPGKDGDVLYATGRGLVQTWNPTATKMLSQFGSANIEGMHYHDGGPYAFYYPDQAVMSAGNIYAADGLGTITVTAPNGLLAGATTLGGALGNGVDLTGDLGAAGGNLYAETGAPFDAPSNTISVVPIATVTRLMSSPQSPLDSLGWGAGLDSAVDGNYFPPGTTPSLSARFASWWAPLSTHVELTYQVWDAADIAASRPPATTTVPLPHTAEALARVPVPLPSTDRGPGPYEIEAKLYNTSTTPPTTLGTLCLPYTVGAPGDHLDLPALPGATGAGGPTDDRGVVLNSELGLSGLRSGQPIDWSSLLPRCNAAAPTPSTCGPGAMDLSAASTVPFKAAYLAVKDDVRYWIQASVGDATTTALVRSHLWEPDIRALVAHYSHVPTACRQCAPVTAWEAWNEPNNTGWSKPAAYVTEVLKPFYEAVRAVRPGDTVIGGSSLDTSLPWWRGLIAAGGLKDMTVAGVHPYPGNNDAWEEDGIVRQLLELESMIGHKPLWITEVGWWTGGDYNYLHQADAVARAMIWQRLLDIPVWSYFINEGDYNSFALIQADDGGGNGDDAVEPAALAAMAEYHELTGRPVLGQVATGIPQSYDARFGPKPGENDHVAAVWSDGLATTASLSASAPGGAAVNVLVTNEYGATVPLALAPGKYYALPISDQVVYLTYPSGDTLRVEPTERYGADVALVSSGASATASSGHASAALVDPSDATDEGQGWASTPTDRRPSITVKLAHAGVINRVLVDTQSVGSTAPGLRDYTVSVEAANGRWTPVASITEQFRDHIDQVAFDPVDARAVRIEVALVNLGGYAGGGLPSFCTLKACVGFAFIHAIEIYRGTATPATVAGRGLLPLRLPA